MSNRLIMVHNSPVFLANTSKNDPNIAQNIAHEKTMTFGKCPKFDEANSQCFQIKGKGVSDFFVSELVRSNANVTRLI